MSKIQENKTYLILPDQLEKIREIQKSSRVSIEKSISEKKQGDTCIKLDGTVRTINDPLIEYNSDLIEQSTRILSNYELVKYQPNFIDVGTVFIADMHYANGIEEEEMMQFVDTTLGMSINEMDQYIARESEYGKYFDGKRVGEEIRYTVSKGKEVRGIITDILPADKAKTFCKI
ncbi:MAG: hypothetical protein RSB99_01470 [Bacilli bacterium]